MAFGPPPARAPANSASTLAGISTSTSSITHDESKGRGGSTLTIENGAAAAALSSSTIYEEPADAVTRSSVYSLNEIGGDGSGGANGGADYLDVGSVNPNNDDDDGGGLDLTDDSDSDVESSAGGTRTSTNPANSGGGNGAGGSGDPVDRWGFFEAAGVLPGGDGQENGVPFQADLVHDPTADAADNSTGTNVQSVSTTASTNASTTTADLFQPAMFTVAPVSPGIPGSSMLRAQSVRRQNPLFLSSAASSVPRVLPVRPPTSPPQSQAAHVQAETARPRPGPKSMTRNTSYLSAVSNTAVASAASSPTSARGGNTPGGTIKATGAHRPHINAETRAAGASATRQPKNAHAPTDRPRFVRPDTTYKHRPRSTDSIGFC